MTNNQNGMSSTDIAKIAGAVVVILIAIFIIMRVYRSQQPYIPAYKPVIGANGQVVQPEGPKAAWIKANKQAFDAQLKQQKGQ